MRLVSLCEVSITSRPHRGYFYEDCKIFSRSYGEQYIWRELANNARSLVIARTRCGADACCRFNAW